MKTMLIVIGIAGLLLGVADHTRAHVGNRVYPIFELTDEDVAVLDLTDGIIEDWLDIVGEPTLTALDFVDLPSSPPYDPFDLDFRIWLGWHRSTNRIYGAMQQADDVYILNDKDRQSDIWLTLHEAAINFYVDGDHSAGELVFAPNCCDTEEEYLLLLHQTAQWHLVLGGDYSAGPRIRLVNLFQEYDQEWFLNPPYADSDGNVFGENPIITITEFYVTPFDHFVWNNSEESLISELYPGKIIGFTMSIHDQDSEEDIGAYLLGETGAQSSGDAYVDGILLGPGGEIPDDSAVESITWGRIKATFVK